MNTSFAEIVETDLPQENQLSQNNPSPQEPPTNDSNSRHSSEREIALLKQRATGTW